MTKHVRSNSPLREKLQVAGLPAPVEVRRHPAARRMTLRVSRTRRTVIVTLPMQCDLKQAGDFLSHHVRWVRERLDHIPSAQPFEHGALIPLRGVPHEVRFRGLERGKGVVVPSTEHNGCAHLDVFGPTDMAPRRLGCWLMEQCRLDVGARVAGHAKALGLHPKRIAIRDQVSRWGSCSSTGNLSFSWRLILAPPTILDYVAAHEVAHLREMNHGPKFWALVREVYPNLEEARQWLDLYGVELHRYGAAR
ncbi:MAG: M48 family metallopeptidase [Hyphomicrobiaceae bacterium]